MLNRVIESESTLFNKSLVEADLVQAVTRLVEISGERATEEVFYTALTATLENMRHKTCSTCRGKLVENDWDVLGNRTDECEPCAESSYNARFKEVQDTLWAPFKTVYLHLT